jgi:hypothetical protein
MGKKSKEKIGKDKRLNTSCMSTCTNINHVRRRRRKLCVFLPVHPNKLFSARL